MHHEPATHVVGVDLGGTRLRTALADRAGKVIRQNAVPTQAEEGRDAVIARVAGEVRGILGTVAIAGLRTVAVAVPAPVAPVKGIVFHPPNLPGWGEVPLKAILEEELRLPVAVGNDANVAALAEHQFGAGRGHSNLVYVTVSTGIGGGVIEAGRLLLGSHGGAAEIGHMTIDMNGPRCPCGNHGCLEAMASGTSIGREAARRLAAGARSILGASGDAAPAELIAAEAVFRAAESGDALAKDVVEWAAYNLGVGLTNAMHLYDPDVIAVGGGVSNAWDMLYPTIRRAIEERAMPSYAHRIPVVRSQLGDSVGLLGAVALALMETT
jgi:glucokinase